MVGSNLLQSKLKCSGTDACPLPLSWAFPAAQTQTHLTDAHDRKELLAAILKHDRSGSLQIDLLSGNEQVLVTKELGTSPVQTQWLH